MVFLIDVGAVGTSVYSAYIDSTTTYASLSGTSMAAPYVAALAALIKSYNSDLSATEIRRLIQRSASRSSSSTSTTMGYGLIDAKRALFLAGEDSLYDTNTSAVTLLGSNGLYSDLLCYPNPLDLALNSLTTCTYYLNRSATVDAWIYSRRGELLKKESNILSAGKQTLTWYGTDRSGNQVPNGVYQLILTATPTDGSDAESAKHLITVYE
jgi:hypothetical protein